MRDVEAAPISQQPTSADHPINEGWDWATLGEVGEYLNGKAFKLSEWSDKGRPIIRIQDLTKSKENPNYFEGEIEDRYVVRPGDLLISWSATLGAYLWDGPEGLLNQHIFKVNSRLDKRFHLYLVQHFLNDLHRQTHGSGLVHVTKTDFIETPVLIPPVAEQKRIVAKLDELFKTINCTRDRLAKIPAILQRFRQAVLAAACSGRLTEDWRDNQSAGEPTSSLMESVLAERKAAWARTKYRPPSEMDSDELPDIPESWRWVSFDSLVTDSFYGPRFSTDEYAPEGVPTIRTSDIGFDGSIQLNNPPRLHLSKELLRDLCLRHEDLLVTRTGATIGKCALYEEAIGPAIPSAYLIRFRLTRKSVPPKYVLLFLMSPLGQQRLLGGSTAVAQPNVNAKNIGRFPVPLPPRTEITEIVRRVELLLALADPLEERIAAATLCANKLTQSILGKAFRGELVPTEADLARQERREYEPASVLLKRIKAQKAEAVKNSSRPQRKARKVSAHV